MSNFIRRALWVVAIFNLIALAYFGLEATLGVATLSETAVQQYTFYLREVDVDSRVEEEMIAHLKLDVVYPLAATARSLSGWGALLSAANLIVLAGFEWCFGKQIASSK